MAASIPDRIRAAVESLDVRPADRLLEIGPGSGVSVGHLFYDGAAAVARSESIVRTLVEQLAGHGLTARPLEPPLVGVVAPPRATA